MFDVQLIYDSVYKLGVVFVAWLPRLVAALVLFGIALLLARAASWAARRAVRGHAQRRNLQIAVGRIAFSSAVAVGILLAATVAFPTFTVGSLIQLLGVSGVVIGFAFKDIFQNFLAGILLLLTNPFDVGDQIIVDTFEGTIEEVQTRATVLTTFDRRRVLIPNSDLFTKSVTVNTAYATRRMCYDVTVKGTDDVEKVKQILERAVHSGIEGVEDDPVATALLLSIAEEELTFRLLWWSSSKRGEYLIVQHRLLAVVFKALHEAQLTTA